MELKIAEKDCKRNELKIPDGYRLIKDWELLKLHRERDKRITEVQHFWVKMFEITRAAWFGCNSKYLCLYGVNNLDSSSAARGVFVKIEGDK